MKKKGLPLMDDAEVTVPTEDEINEVLDLYDAWLRKEYKRSGDKDTAIDNATEKVAHSTSGKVFFWVADNDYARIYDVDDTIVE